MRMRPVKLAALMLSIAIAGAATFLTVAPSSAVRAQGRGLPGNIPGVYKAQVKPNWFDNGAKFWYLNSLRNGAREFILVDADAGTKKPAFDQQKLAAALAKASDTPVDADHLPFDAIEFVDANKAIRFTVGANPGTSWKCDLSSYAVTKAQGEPVAGARVDPSDRILNRMISEDFRMRSDYSYLDDPVDTALFAPPQAVQGRGGAGAGAAGRGGGGGGRGAGGGGGRGGGGGGRGPGGGPVTSPDGKWTASISQYNIIIRSADGTETQISKDGAADDSYTRLAFSPDSKSLIAFRLSPRENKEVYRIQSSPPLADNQTSLGGVGRAITQTSVYPLPGDKFDSFELSVFNLADQKQTKPDFDRIDYGQGGGNPTPSPRWLSDGYHFLLEKYDRSHQRFRLIEVDAHTGTARNVIDEQEKGFVWSAHMPTTFTTTNYTRNENEIIYLSEMNGWRHIYMVDEKTGTMKPITKGDWVVRGVSLIDQDARQIWFTASGIYPDQDPYLIQYGRVNFDGTGLVWLTSANGNHSINFADTDGSFSPGYKYYVDSYNRIDAAPVSELHRASDGKLITPLETADVEAEWIKPEVFTAKARDGKTDIWGIIYRPANIDPSKKYPIIENIYAGPHGSSVPKAFSLAPRGADAALTQLGFIIVHIDGMGTANRSKAFHDVCWQNIKDAGFEDRILWMKAMAAKYPYMDIDRVGIFGTSAGGQNACAALLFHPDFYKVAVANSGCHDNRMDKASWNEEWMGYPVGPQYSASSNIDNAYLLKGRLQLVLGELDTNVPPESTFRLVNALVQGGKDFEFVFVPGADHGAASPITQRKLTDFFVRYLQTTEPSNHNLEPPPARGRGGAAPAAGRAGRGGAGGGRRGATTRGGNDAGGGGGAP